MILYRRKTTGAACDERLLQVEAFPFSDDATTYALLHWLNQGIYLKFGADTPFVSWENGVLQIPDGNGWFLPCHKGDFVVRFNNGNVYPCSAKLFGSLYEPVANTEQSTIGEGTPARSWLTGYILLFTRSSTLRSFS